MVHKSRRKEVKFIGALKIAQVIQQHRTRRSIVGVIISSFLIDKLWIAGVDGKTHRSDLPDNGFRFLPLDAEKIIPSSTEFINRSLQDQDGNPQNLRNSFITFSIIFPAIVIGLTYLSWKRRRKDHELYNTVLAKRLTQNQLIHRYSQAMRQAELLEKSRAGAMVSHEWTSLNNPLQPAQNQSLHYNSSRDLEKGALQLQDIENQILTNIGINPQTIIQQPPLHNHNSIKQSAEVTPHSIDTKPETNLTIHSTPPLNLKSSLLQPSQAKVAVPETRPLTPIIMPRDPAFPNSNLSCKPGFHPNSQKNASIRRDHHHTVIKEEEEEEEEEEIEEEVAISVDRKAKVDSILIYCEKKKHNLSPAS
ncbi:hypothetical protein PCASD_18190 [Puccinia coronata f. sp. avenae]|uniref:Uncharacterized protein n=1 Tax=Puccinia coronata f. sp. avenae TaxID=200324 RepID=A0A2N5T2C8_9BASI|nr:hypothetical protein PCASD_18190 [Puccinia coronata f. sp. avenae]